MRKAGVEDANDHGERGGLGPDRHECGDRNRRSLIDVGRPHVEGGGRNLECKPHPHHQDAQQQKRIARGRRGDVLGDLWDQGRPRRAVDERHPIEDEGAGESSDQEVLGGRFLRTAVRSRKSASDVERDREQLEAEKDRHQRRGRAQHHHADHRGHDQDVELGLAQSAADQIRVRDGHGQDAEDREQDLEEDCERVAGRISVVGRPEGGEFPAVGSGCERVRVTDHRHHRDHTAPSNNRDGEVGDDRKEHEAGQRGDGADLSKVGKGLRPVVAQARCGGCDHLARPTCTMEVMKLVSTPGARPSANMRITSGASSVSWLAWMSSTGRSYGFSAYIAPWKNRRM